VTAGLAVAGVAALAGAVPRDHFARLLVSRHGGTLVAYEESPGGTVVVVAEPFRETSFRRLFIQGVSNSHDGLMSRRYMRLQALLPLLVHDGEPRAAMVVGLGTGITCGALLAWPGLERRVCVELLPAVVRATRHFDGNYGVTDDPRVEIRVADARHDLLVRDDLWDVVTLEPPPPVAAGVVNLYSRDFYALCRRRLAPRGLMAQWLPLSTQNDEDTRSLVRSFIDVFPHATLWSTELHEMLLLGSAEPIVLDAARIAVRLAEPAVAAALAEVGVADTASLLATWVTDRAGLERYAGDAPAVTDDRPRIEHAGPARAGEFARTLAHLLESRSAPPLAGADDALGAGIAARRERLLDFYQAAVYWYAGRPDEMEPLLARVLGEEPDNPYYRWFVGG
jgi:spermidine synthase